MDEGNKHLNPNPQPKANFLSKLFFCWLNPLFKIGHKRSLEITDMYNVLHADSSEHLGDKLQRNWDEELRKTKDGKKPSLRCALIHTFGRHYCLLGIAVFILEMVHTLQPVLVGGLIRYFSPAGGVTKREAYLYAFGLSVSSLLHALGHHPYFFTMMRIGMKVRIACCSLVYRKSLRLSHEAMGKTTVGQIVNLMSNDVNRFDQALIFGHFLWVGPIQALVILGFLWYQLGPASLAGFLILLLLIPGQVYASRLFSKLRVKIAVQTDERVRIMNEIISGMRVIKMYCWETMFGELITKVRNMELKQIKTANYARAFIQAPFFSSAKIIAFLTFITYAFTGNRMVSDKVFVALALYQPVRVVMTLFVPMSVTLLSEMFVTIKRLEKFLLLEELEETPAIVRPNTMPKAADCKVTALNVSAMWDKSTGSDTLSNVSFEVRAGELLAVIGPVGAGKSSLLMSILGELPPYGGSIKVNGKVAYAAQQPWVFSASIRQNIIFGQKFEAAKYQRVLQVAALVKDLQMLPEGDQTMVGERGVSLSGGQKARVNLARALYFDADIYLLDDPLSAVDATVGKHLFDKCICGFLKDKPRILVTHQLQFLQSADRILILKETEDWKDLIPEGYIFELQPEFVSPAEKEESRQVGRVGLKVYWRYFTTGAGCIGFIAFVLLNILAQLSFILCDWWLAYWANEEEARQKALLERDRLVQLGYNATNITIPVVQLHRNAYIFTGITLSVFIFGLLRALIVFAIFVRTSMKLHNRMFKSIARAPMLFFDTNPSGRILNRFSKDMGALDETLPLTMYDFTQCSMTILGIVLVASVINPWVLIPTLPITVIFLLLRQYFLQTSRDVKRLEATTRSPVFSHLNASLLGLSTIRAYQVEDRFKAEFDCHQDLHTEAWYLFLVTTRWFAIRLEWLCCIFIIAVTFCCIFAADNLNGGLVGLTLMYVLGLMGLFQWGVRLSAEVESQMTSAERVFEYTKLPSEAPLQSEDSKGPPDKWPVHGIITGENASFRYSEDAPKVLKNMNFCVRAREKVGIIGRTGAGKSSLVAMLFRMAEPEGKVRIDGINIKDIGLHDLRQKLSIIPQDPVLFTGVIRRNLDPFGHHNDEDLWNAVREVQLEPVISDLPGRLQAAVSEGGSNFSVGQRQLLCLARAILRKNRILLIDEATANVDPRTDALIQQTIRQKFKHCTVLTIAHRLNTIMDSDRVLVLDEGRIKEFDEPYTLLQDDQSLLYTLVEQTGKSESEHLLEIAKQAYFIRNQPDPTSVIQRQNVLRTRNVYQQTWTDH